MIQSSYNIWLRDKDNALVDMLDERKILSINAARNVYGSGSLEMALTENVAWSTLTQDARIEVWHTSSAGVTSLLTGTQWLINSRSKSIDNGSKTLIVKAEPLVCLCVRRIVAYAAGTSYASKTGNADNLMKAIMRENYGSLAADSARNLSSHLTIAADTSAAPSISMDFAWRNVQSVLLDLAAASAADATTPTRLYFDIYYDIATSKPVFATYVGQPGTDHTSDAAAPVIFSYQRNNIMPASLAYDYAGELNYVYGLGQDTGTNRVKVEVSDSTRMAVSTWNRREAAQDARQCTTSAGVGAQAREALWNGRPFITIGGTLISTPDTEFGTHWGLGDLVTAEFDDVAQDSLVESVLVQVKDGNDQISGTARSVV